MKKFILGLVIGAILVLPFCLITDDPPKKHEVNVIFAGGFDGQDIGLAVNSEFVFVGIVTPDDVTGFASVITGTSDSHNVEIELSWGIDFSKSINQIEKFDLREGRFLLVMFGGDKAKPFVIQQTKIQPKFF